MGAWTEYNFGNDSALNWVSRFQENLNISFIRKTLSDVLNDNGYIGVDKASAVLAAAEVIAALKGCKSRDFPKILESNISDLHLEEDLINIAKKAIRKIFQDSELKELWFEGDGIGKEWTIVINDLIMRLDH